VKWYALLKESGTCLVIGDGEIYVDDELIATVKDARTGIFKGILYRDYPKRSPNSIGGIMGKKS
jgi:3-hydroxyacyl-[acyl-carrier protein] dehydratase/trans-2-decenoyl-[acyl-carrier protein] isomerase